MGERVTGAATQNAVGSVGVRRCRGGGRSCPLCLQQRGKHLHDELSDGDQGLPGVLPKFATAAAWGPASEEALRAAQAAFGITVDGKWGPQTEDAIQGALQVGCTEDRPCEEPQVGPVPGEPVADKSTDAVSAIGRLGWIVGGVTVLGLAVGVAITVRRSG